MRSHPACILTFLLFAAGGGVSGLVTATDAGCHAAAKIAGHVQPLSKWGASVVCDSEAPAAANCQEGTGSDLVPHGELLTEQVVYFVATDLDASLGLTEAAFSIQYDGAPGSGVDVIDYLSCADVADPGASWPASGGTIRFEFSTCQGTTWDPEDLYQSSVVLGALRVIAYGDDAIDIEPMPGADAYVVDCEGESTVVADCDGTCGGLGIVGFGNAGDWDPCQGDFFSQANTCCLPDGCASLSWNCCLSAEGIFIPYEPCSACSVPVRDLRWGRLKSLHD